MAYRSRSTVSLINGLFILLTLLLGAALVQSLRSAWVELRDARRTEALAAADHALYETGNAVRLSRGNSQELLQTRDDPKVELDSIRNTSEARITAMLMSVRPLLPAADEAKADAIVKSWKDVAPSYQQILALAAKPRAERMLQDTLGWYKAVGATVDRISDLSLSLAGVTRMSDPAVGEYVLARQYAWSARASLGDECSFTRSVFTGNHSPDVAMRQRIAGMRGSMERSLTSLADLLARPGAPRPLVDAMAGAREAVARALAFRDAAYASLGGPSPTTPADWAAGCNEPYPAVLKIADVAISGMAERAAKRRHAALERLLVLGGVTLGTMALAMVAVGMVRRRVATPVRSLSVAIGRLAERDYATSVAALPHADEFGAMARTLETLREGAAAIEQMEAERETERAVKEARATRLDRLMRSFESTAAHLVGLVSTASGQLKVTAGAMATTAQQSGEQADTIVTAVGEANAGVQTVAAAAEELTASINEISQQVAQSARITGQAVERAQRTDDIVRALAESASRIGAVVELISGIAGQTNLLALNATIEAARAGEAGKGFGVVASEVKGLATQTTRATGDIVAQIGQIQSATRDAVAAIGEIAATISEVSALSASIAAAVEEQGTATAEIARSVQQTAINTRDVATNVLGVRQAAVETGATASQVLDAASRLSEQAEQLSSEVHTFVEGIRAA